jgi:hypothetical protein
MLEYKISSAQFLVIFFLKQKVITKEKDTHFIILFLFHSMLH